MQPLTAILLCLGAYLVGAIPFGLLIGLARGVDVRKHGSGNIGATNVGRAVGKKWGYLALALDILKGFMPTLFTGLYFVPTSPSAVTLGVWLLVAVSAVLGHVFPIYLRFKGGKGVATTIGVALGIWPYYTVGMAAGLAGYAIGRYGTRIVSVGSLALAVVFPVAVFAYVQFGGGAPLRTAWPLVVGAAGIGLLIIVRHRSNIQRLLRGDEPKQA